MLIKAICINASLLNQLLDLCNSCNACMHKTYRNYVLNLEHKETFILITVLYMRKDTQLIFLYLKLYYQKGINCTYCCDGGLSYGRPV